jgi:lysophospholipase L1-like esterase
LDVAVHDDDVIPGGDPMRISSIGRVAACLFALGVIGCSSGSSPQGSGGSQAGSGGSGTGGKPATGTGGSPGTGGVMGTGGSGTGGSGAGGSGASGTIVSGTGGTASAGAPGTGGSALGSGGRTQNADGGVALGGAPGLGGTAGGQDSGVAGAGSPGDAASPTGGAGGAGSYSPCPSSPCKILPFGDSITHGLQSSDNGGYRSQLFKLIVAAGQSVTFVGSQSSGPDQISGKTFPKNHEGHDGFTVDSGSSKYGTAGISSLIPSPAFSTIPDIVLLMIGTNDITSSNDPAGTATRLDGLLGKIVAAAPKALIVVAQITPVGYTSADLTNYNAKIPGLVQARVAQGQHIVSVDMSKMPTSDLASDKVHPADAGYVYMAGIWYAALKDLLPK